MKLSEVKLAHAVHPIIKWAENAIKQEMRRDFQIKPKDAPMVIDALSRKYGQHRVVELDTGVFYYQWTSDGVELSLTLIKTDGVQSSRVSVIPHYSLVK